MSAQDHTRDDLTKPIGLMVYSLLLAGWFLGCATKTQQGAFGRPDAIGATDPPRRVAELPAKAKDRSGVTVLERDNCYDGYILYSSRGTEAAHLIDLDGRELHSWSYPQGKTWHYAEMLDNGHLVAIVKDVMILELDWDSKLVWKRQMRAHHDFCRLDNEIGRASCRERV